MICIFSSVMELAVLAIRKNRETKFLFYCSKSIRFVVEERLLTDRMKTRQYSRQEDEERNKKKRHKRTSQQ